MEKLLLIIGLFTFSTLIFGLIKLSKNNIVKIIVLLISIILYIISWILFFLIPNILIIFFVYVFILLISSIFQKRKNDIEIFLKGKDNEFN